MFEALKLLSEQAKPGDRLGTKASLSKQLGVSPGTLNEAMRLLEAEGWIQLRRGPGGGAFAGRPSPIAKLSTTLLSVDSEGDSVSEAFRIRAKLDELLVEDAVKHATEEHHAQLRSVSDDFRLALAENDREHFAQANWRTHEIICDASPNELLQDIYRSLVDIIQRSKIRPSNSASTEPEAMRKRFEERVAVHVELIAAIIDRDHATALDALSRHNTELWRVKPIT